MNIEKSNIIPNNIDMNESDKIAFGDIEDKSGKKICPVCYYEIKNFAYFECSHYVCIECFLKLIDKNTCVLCRKKFNFQDNSVENRPFYQEEYNNSGEVSFEEDIVDVLVLQDRRKIIIECTSNNEIRTNIFNVHNNTKKRVTKYFVKQLSEIFENVDEKRTLFDLYTMERFVYSINYTKYRYEIEVNDNIKKITITEPNHQQAA